MQVINENAKPTNTIYYIAVIIYNKLKGSTYTMNELYDELQESCELNDYNNFLYALNFLFLLDKIVLEKDVIKSC